jgi:hypothetical protein
MAVVWVATSDATDPIGNQTASFPREDGLGACLRIAQLPTADPRPIADALAAEAAAHDHLFPELAVTTEPEPPDPGDGALLVALWPGGAPSDDGSAAAALQGADACPDAAAGWAFGVTHELLADGADRLLERAEFGSDWSAEIEVSLHPEDARVRSTLRFSGPWGISGSCWIDETLMVGPDGLPGVISESGDDAGLPGLVACRRFEAEMSEGAAGAQAVALFPPSLAAADASPRLRATGVGIIDGLVVVRGETR